MTHDSNLDALRKEPPARGKRPPHSLVLLLCFLLGFAALFLLAFREHLRPRVPVDLETILLGGDRASETGATASPSPGKRIAQASGWIEPAPYPILIPTKIEGFVDRVHVVEGDVVEKGKLLVEMDPSDWQQRVLAASNQVQVAAANLRVSEANITVASNAVQQANARGEASAATLEEAEDLLHRLQTLAVGDVAASEVVRAKQAVTRLRATCSEQRAAVSAAQALVQQKKAERQQASAKLSALQAELALAELQLSRTRVYSPISGRVLRREADPGLALHGSANRTLLALYDPTQLQVRVDVPLANISQISTEQLAEISSSAFPNQRFEGRVTDVVGEADISRNTLEVKVAISAPDPNMRPEMLCRVEFLAPAGPSGTTTGSQTLWIPASALMPSDEGGSSVWSYDPVEETVSRKSVEVGTTEQDGWVPLHSGLPAGSKVVIHPSPDLRDGIRVKGAVQ